MLDTQVVVFCVGAADTASARILPWFETSFKGENARASSRGKLKTFCGRIYIPQSSERSCC
jgi:hypothetical protein